MKKHLYIPLFILSSLLFFNSCELDESNPDTGDIIDDIEGQWKCTENSEYFKSTAQRIYYPYIYRHPEDSTKVIIEDFYEVGNAVATVSGRTLTLPHQNLPDGFILLSGKGTVSSNSKQINWTYRIDDGSGTDIDDATAVYAKSY